MAATIATIGGGQVTEAGGRNRLPASHLFVAYCVLHMPRCILHDEV